MTLEELERIVVDYLDSFYTMTLACSQRDEPWTAPVYYAREGFDLIFFSSRMSQHSRVLEVNPKAAAAIYDHYDEWQDIKGIQMTGSVEALTGLLPLTRAARVYFKRYPFAKDFFSKAGFISDVVSKKTRIMLYAFRSESIHYMDNSVGFGVRWRMDIQSGRPAGPPQRS